MKYPEHGGIYKWFEYETIDKYALYLWPIYLIVGILAIIFIGAFLYICTVEICS